MALLRAERHSVSGQAAGPGGSDRHQQLGDRGPGDGDGGGAACRGRVLLLSLDSNQRRPAAAGGSHQRGHAEVGGDRQRRA
eukprot:scaffold307956_cov31-Prasinocladus_malaysianus.AAC.1